MAQKTHVLLTLRYYDCYDEQLGEHNHFIGSHVGFFPFEDDESDVVKLIRLAALHRFKQITNLAKDLLFKL